MTPIYTQLIEKVLKQLEEGILPWRRAFNIVAKSNSTKQPYSLLNQILLDTPGTYWTYKQIEDKGYRIRKGAKAKYCLFWKLLRVEDKVDKDKTNSIPYLRHYKVFHESDIDGLVVPEIIEPEADYDKAEEIILNYLAQNPELRFSEESHTLSPPGYSPRYDHVHVHEKSQFDCVGEYYSTIFHELIHSTGHKTRLARLAEDAADHNKEDYSVEELVAEIGAAMLCAKCNIKSVEDNAIAYCAGWASKLKENKSWLQTAASRAAEAIDYLLIGMEEDEDA